MKKSHSGQSRFHLDWKHKTEINDRMISDVVKRRADLISVDISKCPNISPIGIMTLCHNLPKLGVLKLEDNAGIFTNWGILPSEKKDDHQKRVNRERAAAEAIREHSILSEISLRGCQFTPTEALKIIASNKRLRSVNFEDCKHLNDDVVSVLSKNKNLEVVTLANNSNITDASVHSLREVPFLKALDFKMCKNLTENSIMLVGTMRTLQILSFNGCVNVQSGFNSYEKHSALRNIDLSFTSVTDVEVSILATIPNLSKIVLDGCEGITKQAMRALSNLQSLRILSINFCRNVLSLNSLRRLKLKELSAGNNPQLSDPEVLDILSIESLEILNLSACTLTQTISGAAKMKNLNTLTLARCKQVDDTIAAALNKSKTISEIDLSGTSVTKSLFKMIGNSEVNIYVFNAAIAVTKIVDFTGCKTIQVKTFNSLVANQNLKEAIFDGCPQMNNNVFIKLVSDCKTLQKLSIKNTNVQMNAMSNYNGSVPIWAINSIVESSKGLDMANCLGFNDGHLDVLKNAELKILFLVNCPSITDTGLGHISRNKHLVTLEVSGCAAVTKSGLKALSRIPNLDMIKMVNMDHAIDKDTIVMFAACKSLKKLKIKEGYDFISPSLFAGSTVIPSAAVLNYLVDSFGSLDLTGCQNITDSDLDPIFENSGLDKVVLDKCLNLTEKTVKRISESQITDISLCYNTTMTNIGRLGKSRTLRSLNLLHCPQLRDEDMRALSAAPQLVDIKISKCKATENGLVDFLNNPLLRRVELLNIVSIGERAFSVLSKAKDLEYLSVQGCGSVENKHIAMLSDLKNLTSLNISFTNVDDDGITELAGSESLSELSCAGTKVKGTMFPILTNLRYLNVAHCRLLEEESLLALVKSSNIEEYNFSETNITDSVIVAIYLKQKVRKLAINGCSQLTDVALVHLGNIHMENVEMELNSLIENVTESAFADQDDFPQAKVANAIIDAKHGIDLSGNLGVTGDTLRRISGNRDLTRLIMQNTNADDSVVDVIRTMKFLEVLDLSGCDSLRKVIAFNAIPNLKKINLLGCWRLNDDQIGSIVLHQSITSIKMSRMDLTDSTIQKIPRNISLVEITLNGINSVNFSTLAGFKDLQNLTYLDLKECSGVEDTSLRVIGGFKRLLHLNVSNCPEVSDVGVSKLSDLRLVHLDLSHTKTTGMTLHSSQLSKGSLRVLNLANCPLNPQCFRAFRNCRLDKLDMSGVKNITVKDVDTIFAKNMQIDFVVLERCQKVNTNSYETQRRKAMSEAQIQEREAKIKSIEEKAKPRKRIVVQKLHEEEQEDMEDAESITAAPAPSLVGEEVSTERRTVQHSQQETRSEGNMLDKDQVMRTIDHVLAKADTQLDSIIDMFDERREDPVLLAESKRITGDIDKLIKEDMQLLLKEIKKISAMQEATRLKEVHERVKFVLESTSVTHMNIDALMLTKVKRKHCTPLKPSFKPNFEALSSVSVKMNQAIRVKLRDLKEEIAVIASLEIANRLAAKILIIRRILRTYLDSSMEEEENTDSPESGESPIDDLFESEKESTIGIGSEVEYNIKLIERMVKSNMTSIQLSISVATLIKGIKRILDIDDIRDLDFESIRTSRPAIKMMRAGLDDMTKRKIVALQGACINTLKESVEAIGEWKSEIVEEKNVVKFAGIARKINMMRDLISFYFGSQYIKANFESSVDLLIDQFEIFHK